MSEEKENLEENKIENNEEVKKNELDELLKTKQELEETTDRLKRCHYICYKRIV